MNISDIAVNEFIFFGKIRGADIIWEKISSSNEFITTTSVFRTKFDEIEPNSTRTNSIKNGSNFWPQSNLFQLLNSDERTWFKEAHDADTVNVTMARLPGFLHDFSDWEISAIIPQEVTTIVPKGFRKQFGSAVKTTARVSIPSKSQFVGGDDLTEGERFEGITDMSRQLIGTFTRTASATCIHLSNGRPVPPCSLYNVFPVIRINAEMSVEYDNISNIYSVMPPQSSVKAIEESLKELLK